MAELVARGPGTQSGWRRTLPDEPVSLGRVPARSAWATPWDQKISSLHAVLTWRDDQLHVRRMPDGRNPIFYRGQALDEFTLAPGETFIIGETTFTLEATPAPEDTASGSQSEPADLPSPDAELTCSQQELRRVKYVDAEERIDVLAALPEMIRFAPGEAELESRVLDVLLRGIPRAEAAAIVRIGPAVEMRAAVARDQRLAALQPSRRLIDDAICRRRQSVLHRWDLKEQRLEFTVHAACDWALCVPLPDEPSPGWGLYATGRLQERPSAPAGASLEDLLKGDLKFAEVVADIFGSLRQVRHLQRRQTQLAGVLPMPVLAVLAQEEVEKVLQPRQAEVTVLFCDLRGSCRIMDEGQADLPALWGRISAALNIMTGCIIDQDGVIGDLQGDAAMGFWGWPLDANDQVERAARAALSIRRHFTRVAQERDSPLAGFACGIGIAHGPAMAGMLGTHDQVKVGVFGPVVNLASRLESMTKLFRVPILLDEATARDLGGGNHWCRCRRLVRVRPHGMLTVHTVSELLPPAVEPGSLPERDRKDYEAALDAFLTGRWEDASDLLRRLPRDGPAEQLRTFMDRQPQRPPAGWDGVMALEGK